MPIVDQLFPNKVISRRGNISWPPRSPDLTPMDFYLWGYLKSQVYDTNPRSVDALKKKISEEKLLTSQNRLTGVCCDRNGLRLDNVTFKK